MLTVDENSKVVQIKRKIFPVALKKIFRTHFVRTLQVPNFCRTPVKRSCKKVVENLNLTRNQHNGTCRIHSDKYEIHLGNFGLLLGFVKDTVITRGTKVDSGEVDVNSGFRLVTIGCDIVNPTKNFNPGGKRSKTIATFPITTEQPLFNYVSFHKNVNFEAPVINGIHNRLLLSVDTNIDEEVEMNILAEFYFK